MAANARHGSCVPSIFTVSVNAASAGTPSPDTATHDDLVKRQFTADGSHRVWFTDINQHRASDGRTSAALSLMRGAGASWVGLLLITHAANWSSMRSRSRAGNDHARKRCSTPIEADNAHHGFSITGCGQLTCWDQWGALPPACDNALVRSF